MEIDILQLLAILGAEALGFFALFRLRLSQIRKVIDRLDDALYDDKVTEEEYRGIWEAVKALFGK